MKILVCVKEVHDPESPIRIAETGWIDETQMATFRMNRYDEFALEEAVQINEAIPGAVVHTLGLGPERVKRTLTKSLEKGAHEAYHINVNNEGYIPPEAVARLLCSFIKDTGYDLILTGAMSEDLMQSVTGPLIAAYLGLPCAPAVVSQKLNLQDKTITVESEIEGGLKEQATLTLPCMLTIQSGINRPRYPSLSNVMRAKTQEIHEVLPAEAITACSPDQALLSYPEAVSMGEILQGSREEQADRLIDIFHEKGLL